MKNIIISASLLLSVAVYGQEETTSQGLDGGNIEEQFDYLIDISGKYQDNRVIKNSRLNKLRSNIEDSLELNKSKINELNSSLQLLEINKSNLNSEKDSLKFALESALQNKDSFEILGTKTTKGAFRFLFFVVTGILSVIALLFFFRMRSKVSKSSIDTSRFNALEIEFEDFKKRSREKEQALARQLQDEINKGM